MAGVALLLVGAWLGVQFWGRHDVGAQASLRKFQWDVGSDIRDAGFSDAPYGPVISPDGRMVVFAQDNRLWIRELDQLAPRAMPDTGGADGPFWNPTGDTVAYVAGGVFSAGATLKKVPIAGGSSSTICELKVGGRSARFLGGAWSPNGTIVVGLTSLAPANGLYQVPASGGDLKPLLLADRAKGAQDFHSPYFLPDGRTLLLAVHPLSNQRLSLAVRSERDVRTIVVDPAGSASSPVYSSSGHLLFERFRGHKSICAIPFSLATLTVSGEPFVVAEEGGRPSLSREGTLLYESGAWAKPFELALLDRRGQITQPVSQSYEVLRHPSFTPDGKRVALTGIEGGNWDIWVHDLVRGGRTRVTTDESQDTAPAWSPDGDRIAFITGPPDGRRIAWKKSDGSGDAQTLVDGPSGAFDWNGAYLVFLQSKGDKSDIWYVPPDGNRQPKPYLETAYSENNPRLSPDGRFLAYESDQSGKNEIYVSPFPQGGTRVPVSVKGGMLPRWSRAGDRIFYLEGPTLMLAAVRTLPTLEVLAPTPFFASQPPGVQFFSFTFSFSAYDVAPDGNHVFGTRRVGGGSNSLTLVQNWFAEFTKQ